MIGPRRMFFSTVGSIAASALAVDLEPSSRPSARAVRRQTPPPSLRPSPRLAPAPAPAARGASPVSTRAAIDNLCLALHLTHLLLADAPLSAPSVLEKSRRTDSSVPHLANRHLLAAPSLATADAPSPPSRAASAPPGDDPMPASLDHPGQPRAEGAEGPRVPCPFIGMAHLACPQAVRWNAALSRLLPSPSSIPGGSNAEDDAFGRQQCQEELDGTRWP